ncbi:MAG: 50S ribosomal protein L21 [Mycoplasmataceae bacterium]|jgi:large subunit ribosomal protein L21|nr:50S ribosomal protein L21 [Mycoplasmataceae bacterium]
MFAIIETGNKQYKVTSGDVIFVEKLDVGEEKSIEINKVLMLDGKIGKPYIDGAKVICDVVKQVKGEKLMIIKHISQKHHTKRSGHRQKYTKLLVKEIVG